MSTSIRTMFPGGDPTNQTDKRAQQIISLIQTYIPSVKVLYGYRGIGSSDQIVLSLIMIEPLQTMARMEGTGLWKWQFSFGIFFFTADSNTDTLPTLQTSLAEDLIKLFSNNALNDIGSGNTGQFKANPGFWDDSEITPVLFFKTARQSQESSSGDFIRAGIMKFECESHFQP